jgi:PAS domain S-box-containing protein
MKTPRKRRSQPAQPASTRADENARLVRQAEQAREAAEAAERRTAFLAEAGAILTSSLDYDTTLGAISRLAVPRLADWCAVDLVEEDGSVRRLEVAHVDSAKVKLAYELQARYPFDPEESRGVARVLRTGEPEYYPEISDEMLEAGARDAEHLEILRSLQMRSAIVAPLAARGRTLGAMTLVWAESNRRYGPGDLVLAREVAARAGLAVDNAQLYRQAQEASETFQAMVRASPLSVTVINEDGTVALLNPAAERIFGWTAEEAVGKLLPTVPEARREELRASLRSVLRGEFPQGLETRRRRKDGRSIDVSLWAAPLPTGRGGFRILSLAADVTERRRMENALRESDARIRSLMDTAAEGVWLIDAEGQTTYVNQRMAEMLQREVQEMVGRSAWADFDPSSVPAANRGWQRCREGVRQHLEFLFRRKDGSELWAHASISPISDESGEFAGILGMVTDVTESRRLDRELRRRVEQLAEADRRKDEFLAMLAHELRNPMAALSNAGQVLGRVLPEGGDPRVGDLLSIFRRQIGHLTRLVDDLLDVGRFTGGRIELRRQPVELRPIVEGAVETVRPFLDGQESLLEVTIPDEPLWIEADATRIEQVLSNLLNNAAKFSEPGSRIWLTAEPEGAEVVLRVRDEGVGISAELLPKMFDLFVQDDRSLARSHGGLGLGLTLVRELVERHGGSVRAASAGPGQGSELTVRLPRLEGPPAEAGTGGPEAEAAGRPRRVLLVEDNQDAAWALAELLRLWGHEVKVAHDGAVALETARGSRFEIVLLDIGLPGMDGYQVAEALRGLAGFNGATIVALTGYGQESDRLRSARSGIDHHLVKPVDVEALRQLISAPGAEG